MKRIERKAHKTITRIYEQARASRDENGEARVSSKDVASILRIRLKAEFPGVKFSVRSDYNSIHVRWTDGPHPKFVERIANSYSFGGFDGMIDLSYHSANWLLPDGRMEPASSPGTVGSMGCHYSYATDCPEPGAVIVKYGPKYVFCQQEYSPELWQSLADHVCRDYGHPVGQVPHSYILDGEHLSSRIHREQQDKAEKQLRRMEKPRYRLSAGKLVPVS